MTQSIPAGLLEIVPDPESGPATNLSVSQLSIAQTSDVVTIESASRAAASPPAKSANDAANPTENTSTRTSTRPARVSSAGPPSASQTSTDPTPVRGSKSIDSPQSLPGRFVWPRAAEQLGDPVLGADR